MNWLTRLTIVVSTVAAVIIALSIFMLRYWILPDIGQYHDKIAGSLADAIGNHVSIATIEGDWQGFQPRLSLVDVRILNDQGQPALVLPRIDATVSWMSIFTAELRLTSLEISRPELLVRRDINGKIFVGGIALLQQEGDSRLADWLLHQYRMVVRDALIVWVDELRNAPPLVLQRVNLRIENLFSQHRFALHGIPPDELATPLDVRGEFRGNSFNDFSDWRGQIFSQLDHTDITAWRPWLELPSAFSLGKGALRGWLGVEQGKVMSATVDMALYDVSAKLAVDVPEIALLELRGRAAWQLVEGGIEISTKDLALKSHDGIELIPTSLYFFTATSSDQQSNGGVIRANLLQLDSLSKLAKYFPLPSELHEHINNYAPRGNLSNLEAYWQGTPEQLSSYKFKGHIDELAINQVGKMPGFSGLTLDVDGNDEAGKLSINTRQLQIEAPDTLREALWFDTLTGQAGWQRSHDEVKFNFDNVAIANEDLAGNLFGSYQTQAGTLGVLDLTGKLARGDIRRAARYTPLIALAREGNDWLNNALLAGHSEDFRIRIKGNLSDFPIDGSKKVLFRINGHASDAAIEFHSSWPKIENINGEFSIVANRLEVKFSSATMAGARLKDVTVTLPDMLSKDLALEIKGEALASNKSFLQFIQKSPVRGYINGFTDGMRASGKGNLDLSLHIPLKGELPLKVVGTVSVQDSDVDLGKAVPLLSKTHGSITFTEAHMQARNITADVLGGTANIDLQSGEDGVLNAKVRGLSNIEKLRSRVQHPVLNYLSGSAAWEADISVKDKSTRIRITSDLQGLGSRLPQPFSKVANTALHLQVEKSYLSNGADVISAQLDKIVSVHFSRQNKNGEMLVKGGVINFGGMGNPPDRDGVWLVGILPELSMQGWEGLSTGLESATPQLPFAGANLRISKLTGYGQTFTDVGVKSAMSRDGYITKLRSSKLNGELEWQSHGYETGGKLTARLSNLYWQPEESSATASQYVSTFTPEQTGQNSHLQPGELPALEIAIEDFQYKGNDIGRFELVGHPEELNWRVRRLRVTNPDGALMGDGIWYSNGRSQVDLLLDISDAGKILERSGYPKTVKNGNGRLEAKLSWHGTPADFNYATLNGTFKLDTGKGRFLKMDPGAGKLLSILSLQALPKRVTLDFTDVFSGGFQFDNINGNALVTNGVIDTQDFHIDGSAAKVTLKGSVDLNDETQNLRVRVLPTIGDSVSLLGAFAAGPAIGVGALIINKVLGDPLDKLVSFEYNVNGTWTEPNVVKVVKGSVKSQ